MGWRGTLGLAIALLVATAILYGEVFWPRPDAPWASVLEPARPTPPGEQLKHLFVFDPAAVTAVRLQRGERAWLARRTADGWQGAEPSVVDDLLRSLRELAEILPIEIAPGALADHGLDPPQSVVELERGADAPLLLLVGKRNPPATGVYVQIGHGGPVALTGALLLWELDKATRTFAPAA
jgi:hypothetical protein